MPLSEINSGKLIIRNEADLIDFIASPSVKDFLSAIPKDEPIEIVGTSPAALVGGALAALAYDLRPVIGTSHQSGEKFERQFNADQYEFDRFAGGSRKCNDKLNTVLSENKSMAFQTSGSTGDGLLVDKELGHLINEVQQLIEILEIDASKRILCLVPPHHIFGFLYGALLPLITGCSVHYSQHQDGLPDVSDDQLLAADLIVTVPALWPLIRRPEVFQKHRTIVTSGAPFGNVRELEFLDLMRSTDQKVKLFEVLGSTETGGIGYRFVNSESANVFSFFTGVRIEMNSDGSQTLFSDFICAKQPSVLLADHLEVHSDGSSFKHLGRSDRIFKWAGKRYSLAQMESQISACYGGAPAIVYFDEDSSLPHGGILQAFVESSKPDSQELYAALRSKFPTSPLPTRIVFLENFPKNQMGKTTKNLLLQAII